MPSCVGGTGGDVAAVIRAGAGPCAGYRPDGMSGGDRRRAGRRRRRRLRRQPGARGRRNGQRFHDQNQHPKRLVESRSEFPVHADVTVYEGRVLLTGAAETPQQKTEAAEIAKTVPGVRAVYNEIEVGPAESFWHSTQDAWITSQVKSNLVFSDVRSVNYDIKTVDGSVYLIGSARTQAELDHATDLARRVRGVKRVVSYVEVRPGAPPGAQQLAGPEQPPPAAGGMPPAGASVPAAIDAPSAAPTTPVEVQKLPPAP